MYQVDSTGGRRVEPVTPKKTLVKEARACLFQALKVANSNMRGNEEWEQVTQSIQHAMEYLEHYND